MGRTRLALWLQTLMQIGTGIAATTIYSPTLFADAGWGGNKAHWFTALNATVGVLGTTVSAFIRDPLGTRRMLFNGAAGQSACMFLSVSLISLLPPIHPNDICRELWHVSLCTIPQKSPNTAPLPSHSFSFSSSPLSSPPPGWSRPSITSRKSFPTNAVRKAMLGVWWAKLSDSALARCSIHLCLLLLGAMASTFMGVSI